MSPTDPAVQELEKETRRRNEGFIHVLQHGGSRNGGQYSVLFAPITGIGGPVPAKHFTGREELRYFLVDRLHLRSVAVDDALKELSDKGTVEMALRQREEFLYSARMSGHPPPVESREAASCGLRYVGAPVFDS